MKIKFLSALFLCCSMLSAESLSKEQEVVAKTILGEARGEGKIGMYWVAAVIAQRTYGWNSNGPSCWRGETPTEVCLWPEQFHCWNKDDKNRPKLDVLLKTHPHREYAITLAKNLHRLNRVYSKGADHYCTLRTKPYWAFDNKNKKWIKPVAIIGNHKFYKLR